MFIVSEQNYILLQYLLIFIPIILSLIAQGMVDGAYKKGQMINSYNGKTGSEVAREMLINNGISDVEVRLTRGYLSDHYNPRNKTLNLSSEVYNGSDASSIAIAAHEVGHAIQHNQGYFMLKLRSSMVGVTNFANNVSWVLIFVGLFLGLFDLLLIGVILFGVVALFQLVTLPVELNASRRAYQYLVDSYVIVSDEEKRGTKSVLRCAAFTYVVALITSIAQILRYVLMFAGRRRDD